MVEEMKTAFWDEHEKRRYRLTQALCQHILSDPSRIDQARRHMQRFMANDEHQAPYYTMWKALLDRSPQEIADALLEDSPHGNLLRETRPSFGSLPEAEVWTIIDQCRAERKQII